MVPYIQGVFESIRFVPHFRILNDPTEIAGVVEHVSTRRRRCTLFRPVDHLNMRRKKIRELLKWGPSLPRYPPPALVRREK